MGRYHKCSVSGCAALCGSELRNGSSRLLHPCQGTGSEDDPAKQVQELIYDRS